MTISKNFKSLDRFTATVGCHWQTDRYRDLYSDISTTPIIPRGAGLSYVAASFGAGVKSIDMTGFDRILDFNPIKREIEVEAGCSLGKIFSLLVNLYVLIPKIIALFCILI